jgi:hypothetical protein
MSPMGEKIALGQVSYSLVISALYIVVKTYWFLILRYKFK